MRISIGAHGARLALALTTLSLSATGAAEAATAPTVTTGGVARLTQTSVTVLGSVNPQGRQTRYSFQYGRTTNYGGVTPLTSAGAGTSAVAAAADLVGLQPNSKYHYRLVAVSSAGTTRGKDRTFTTQRQPLGLSLAATPDPVPFGSGTTLYGTLSGTGNANQTLVLRQNPFPFTGGLQPFGNKVVTDKNGNYSVALLSVPITTQYRVDVEGRDVQSAILTLPVAVRVGTDVSRTRVRRGSRVRFTGSIRPARDGAQVAVQKRTSTGRWVTVAGTITRHRSAQLSTFRKTVRVPRGGRYRIFVGLQDGNYTSGVGRTILIHTRR